MADKFDPYREALIIELATVWPEEYDAWDASEKARIEKLLHESPAEASDLEYIRQHTGFARQIAVTPEDIDRVSAAT